jgi:uncharacterized protein YndB with AHSA1/START domain
MNDTRSIVIERDIPHPPEKIWRALTQPHFLEEWLMQTDFAPEVDHGFSFRAQWGKVEGKVLTVEPHTRLAYTWGDHRLKSTVTWTLSPVAKGTRLRMEQAGFQPDQPRYFEGAKAGWPQFLERLDALLERMA